MIQANFCHKRSERFVVIPVSYIIIKYTKSMAEKTKRQLLEQRLDRIKKNSQLLINKMDKQIASIQQVKDNLNDKSEKMTECMDRFQELINLSAEKMFCAMRPLSVIEEGNEEDIKPKQESIQFVTNKILQSKTICILTGAGVSKNSGIPTFRGKNGLYEKKMPIKAKENGLQQIIQLSPQQFLTKKTFEKYPEDVWQWCKQMQSLVSQKSPAIQHQLINQLCLEIGRFNISSCIATTNIDSLHHKLLNKEKQGYSLYEIHGNFRKYLCYNCKSEQSITQKYTQFKCKKCGSKSLRPFIMLFDEEYDNTFDPFELRKKQFDLTIAIGTSLQTGLSIKVITNSKVVIEINPQCVIKNGEVYQFQKECDKVLEQLVAELKIKRSMKKK